MDSTRYVGGVETSLETQKVRLKVEFFLIKMRAIFSVGLGRGNAGCVFLK